MSLQQELEADRTSGTVCFMRRLRTDDPGLAAEVLAAMGGTYSTSSIVRVLQKRGLKVGKESVSMHRRGGCRQCQTS